MSICGWGAVCALGTSLREAREVSLIKKFCAPQRINQFRPFLNSLNRAEEVGRRPHGMPIAP